MSNHQGEKRIEIFEHTRMKCLTDSRLTEAIQLSNAGQEVILEKETVISKNKKYDAPATIIVSRKRTLEASKAYAEKKVCVHNFASATNPGGGVERGASAQEECICRCSTLFFNLTAKEPVNQFYRAHRGRLTQLYNDDCIYTPNAVVFKTDCDEPVLMEEADWYKVNVITCAAPNLRRNPSNAMNPDSGSEAVSISKYELKKLHIKRMRRILDVAKSHGNEVVILGAFGCGAFQNEPEVVAEAFASILNEYSHDFETIEFAVYCRPGDTRNYDIFQECLGAYCRGRSCIMENGIKDVSGYRIERALSEI